MRFSPLEPLPCNEKRSVLNSYLSMEDRTLLYHRNPSALEYENLQPCVPVMEVDMRSSVNNVFFDDEATLAMAAAFDRACISLGRRATIVLVSSSQKGLSKRQQRASGIRSGSIHRSSCDFGCLTRCRA